MSISYNPRGGNPFRHLRELQGISQYELGRRLGISKHAILRLEQGMYANPLPAVINYFTQSFPSLTPPQLINDYNEFQIETRQRNARLLGDILDELPNRPVGMHPLTYLRTSRNLNLTEFAKLLCLAQNTIYYFENRSINQKIVPEHLIHALHDADYTEQETDAFEEAYAKFRQELLSRQNLHLINSNIEGSVVNG